MKRTASYIIMFVLVIAISGCAIHSDFPFICFRSGCVSQQFSLKGVKKKIGVKLNVARKKRTRKNLIEEKRKNIRAQKDKSRHPEEQSLNDSLENETGVQVRYAKYRVIFIYYREDLKNDTLLVKHSSKHKTLLEGSKSQISALITQRKLHNIRMVLISAVRLDELGKEETASIVRSRRRSIRRFLQDSGISADKIIFN